MTTPYVMSDIALDEGLRLIAYQDEGGVWTIGYGHTGPEVVAGLAWSREDCELQLSRDLQAIQQGMDEMLTFPWRLIADPRQDVLVNVAFNVGDRGLTEFHHMLAACAIGDWPTAAAQLLDSDAARELPRRYGRLAEQLKTGLRQNPATWKPAA